MDVALMPRVADVAYFNHRPGHSEAWKAHGVCRLTRTTDPWHATGRGTRRIREIGKTICNDLCPVREDCLAYALCAHIEYGTWGGLDERERDRLDVHERTVLIDTYRMKVYGELDSPPNKEYRMVTVLAKVNFVSHLRPGETGDVEDTIARAAVRNGYAELVGNPENYDEWMYQGAELRLIQGKPKPKPKAKRTPARKSTASSPAPTKAAGTTTQQVATTSTLEAGTE